jgi:acetyltransferase-like isoleucine patch superfamily enzyme|tara:strand:+ start:107 stop:697 length:591 start_codon:yes stop_codon:yes gene_type:complete
LGILKNIAESIDDSILRRYVKWLWPQYIRPKVGYMKNYQVLRQYFFFQKIIRINGDVPWPVDFRSKIVDWPNLKKGICCDPGDNPGIYINASGGIVLGNNVNIGQNTILTSTNHYKYDHRKKSHTKGISIGDNVWIGANVSIVAGTTIGDNVTIGAGCFIKGNIPSDTTVLLSDKSLEVIPKTKPYEWDCTQDELG